MFEEPFIILKSWRKPNLIKKKDKVEKISKYKNCWTIDEHRGYLNFFRENMDFSRSHEKRKFDRIFVSMKKYVPSRTHVQIKSHHQKMLVKFGSIETVLDKLEHLLKLDLRKAKNHSSILTPMLPHQENSSGEEGSPSETERSKFSSNFSLEDEDIFDILDLDSL